MKKLLPLIKWSGSKRSQAEEIIGLFPDTVNTYYEPFLGGGSILGAFSPKKAICGDVCQALIELWKLAQTKPDLVHSEYKKRWEKLQKDKHPFYYEVRSRFNKKQSPHDLLFLTRTCVNGLIRFNRKGEFNNSLHYSRKGIHPENLRNIAKTWSNKIESYSFDVKHYFDLTKKAGKNDFVYLDPPYFNTRGRYFGKIDFTEFLKYLEDLNNRKIRFALSFDGARGEKSYIVKLPKKLYKRHHLIHSGNSTFNKVQNGKVEKVYESIYLNY
ncbi:MAG: Dam family site-specific DNA-(adenine-N6)-methyltransferase [Candidatus Margulisiibacteriota bacterium]|nr:Dam family site-specific DNA-(adenine-N6)-methyltransferase [Candidatus Margulisiibacteriota bacterium]